MSRYPALRAAYLLNRADTAPFGCGCAPLAPLVGENDDLFSTYNNYPKAIQLSSFSPSRACSSSHGPLGANNRIGTLGDKVELIGMAPEDECEREIFATIRWEREGLAVPLPQLQVIHGDDQTKEAVEDWHYWVNRGYQF